MSIASSRFPEPARLIYPKLRPCVEIPSNFFSINILKPYLQYVGYSGPAWSYTNSCGRSTKLNCAFGIIPQFHVPSWFKASLSVCRTATPSIYKVPRFSFWLKCSRWHQFRTFSQVGRSDDFYQSVCGVSIVKDYYKLQKFNVMEIANKKKRADQVEESGSRVSQIPKSTESNEAERKGAEIS